jgi:hypothetical protein
VSLWVQGGLVPIQGPIGSRPKEAQRIQQAAEPPKVVTCFGGFTCPSGFLPSHSASEFLRATNAQQLKGLATEPRKAACQDGHDLLTLQGAEAFCRSRSEVTTTEPVNFDGESLAEAKDRHVLRQPG